MTEPDTIWCPNCGDFQPYKKHKGYLLYTRMAHERCAVCQRAVGKTAAAALREDCRVTGRKLYTEWVDMYEYWYGEED